MKQLVAHQLGSRNDMQMFSGNILCSDNTYSDLNVRIWQVRYLIPHFIMDVFTYTRWIKLIDVSESGTNRQNTPRKIRYAFSSFWVTFENLSLTKSLYFKWSAKSCGLLWPFNSRLKMNTNTHNGVDSFFLVCNLTCTPKLIFSSVWKEIDTTIYCRRDIYFLFVESLLWGYSLCQ